MPTDQMKSPTLPQKPSETIVDNVEVVMHSLPVKPILSTGRASSAFLLDAISESEPQDSPLQVGVTRLTMGALLVIAAVGSAWLAVSCIKEYMHP